jgi:hypothetical protein
VKINRYLVRCCEKKGDGSCDTCGEDSGTYLLTGPTGILGITLKYPFGV